MEDIKSIIAENIVQLRKRKGMTQIELAERLNYSDKAVSKWERGESVPDIGVLKTVADLFGVTVDYLITAEHENEAEAVTETPIDDEGARIKWKRKRLMITGMSVMLVWLVALLVFIPLDVAYNDIVWHFLAFAYAVPVSMLVWLVFNATWFDRRKNFLIISLMVWTLIASIYLTVLALGYNIWQLYLLGIPGQLIIILWSKIGKRN
jgi:transcriptional regulator with XRE-family HTH domain